MTHSQKTRDELAHHSTRNGADLWLEDGSGSIITNVSNSNVGRSSNAHIISLPQQTTLIQAFALLTLLSLSSFLNHLVGLLYPSPPLPYTSSLSSTSLSRLLTTSLRLSSSSTSFTATRIMGKTFKKLISSSNDHNPSERNDQIRHWVEANGGRFTLDIDKTVTHVICSEKAWKKNTNPICKPVS